MEMSLSPELVDRVLEGLGLSRAPEVSLQGLREIYAAWCGRVPFDNVRKLVHVRGGDGGLLPGGTPEDYFEAWLRHGTGGTCWAGAGALRALLGALGFPAERVVATMLAAPNLPPNHGSVAVILDEGLWLVDTSILHGEPMRLDAGERTSAGQGACSVQGDRREGRWHIEWRPLHKPDGLTCRIEHFGASAADYAANYERTRGWSPFNWELAARVNRGDRVIGAGFGKIVTLHADGRVEAAPATHAERARLLVEEFGFSEEIVSRLPMDEPTPPPPGSATAAMHG